MRCAPVGWLSRDGSQPGRSGFPNDIRSCGITLPKPPRPHACAQSAGVGTADPAGFTVVDVFAMGSAGHVIGAGIILGLKALGN